MDALVGRKAAAMVNRLKRLEMSAVAPLIKDLILRRTRVDFSGFLCFTIPRWAEII